MKYLMMVTVVLTACKAHQSVMAVSNDAAQVPDASVPDSQTCAEEECVPCEDGVRGEQHNVAFKFEGDTRYFFAYVPSTYRCAQPVPLLVDFHGASRETEPEVAYQNVALISTAEREGFIAIRPRATPESGAFRWDHDVAGNERYVHALLLELHRQYNIDESRTYASGFSSGTNMASRFLFRPSSPFSGYAFIGGGTWLGESLPPEAVTLAPRIYRQTGYRDYLRVQAYTLTTELEAAHFPQDKVHISTSDIGHALYAWHFDELWSWLDRAEAFDQVVPATDWTQLPFDTTASITEIARSPGGQLIVTTTDGIWRRDPIAETFVRVLTAPDTALLTDACVTDEGLALAVAGQTLYRSTDFGAHWVVAPAVPEFAGTFFGSSYLTSVDCLGQTVLAGGYWTGVQSSDGGQTWSAASMSNGGTAAQVAAVHLVDETHGTAAGSYRYLSSSQTLDSFTRATSSPASNWFTDVTSTTSGRIWAVGDEGVAAYTDDGRRWVRAELDTTQDLYAVAFANDNVGAVAGRRGTVFITEDGGASWRDVSTQTSDTFAGLVFTSATTLMAGGDGGHLLQHSL